MTKVMALTRLTLLSDGSGRDVLPGEGFDFVGTQEDLDALVAAGAVQILVTPIEPTPIPVEETPVEASQEVTDGVHPVNSPKLRKHGPVSDS